MNMHAINDNAILRPSVRLLTTVRDELRERRIARANRRHLGRELATFNTPAQINDLLGSMRGQDGEAFEEIRTIVLHSSQNLNRFAS